MAESVVKAVVSGVNKAASGFMNAVNNAFAKKTLAETAQVEGTTLEGLPAEQVEARRAAAQRQLSGGQPGA